MRIVKERYVLILVAAGCLVSLILGSGCSNAPVSPDNSGSQSLTPTEDGMISTSVPLSSVSIPKEKDFIDREVLVVLEDDMELSQGAEFFKSKPVTVLRTRHFTWATLYALEIDDYTPVPTMVERFNAMPGVRFAQPNYKRYFTEAPYYPNDPMWEWDGDPDDDPRTNVYEMWGPAKLGASIVWNESKGDNDIVVAIIDTGIRFDHEDLHDNLWMNTDETDGNGIDDDGNGYIDDWWGWNCWQMNNDPNDDGAYAYYHGTGCAGVVAAVQDNNVGLTGIAPGIQLMAVKVLFADNYTSDETIMEALNYVYVNDVDIVSMSFGGYDVAPGFHAAIQAAWDNGNGCLLIAAAGNNNNQTIFYPAGYDEVIAVAATVPFSYGNAPVDERRIQVGWAGWWWGSTYGDWISVSGFGEKYMTTRGIAPDAYWDGVNFWFFNGTSCACPTVVGTAALIKTFHPSETNAWYWSRLEETADDLETPGYDIQTGNGRINALRAVYGPDRYSDYEDSDGFIPVLSPPDNLEPELFDSIHDCPGNPYYDDADLYVLNPEYDGELNIDLDIYSWGENLDIALYSDKAMTSLIAKSDTVNHATSSFENITTMFAGGVPYYLSVYSPADGNSTTYGLDVGYTYNVLSVTGDSITPVNANPGEAKVPFLRLNFDITFDCTLESLEFQMANDSTDDNWGLFRLYRDSNGNSTLDSGDALISPAPVTVGDTCSFTNLDQYWDSSATMYIFLAGDLSTTIPIGTALSAGMDSPEGVQVDGLVQVDDTGFPIESSQVMIIQ